MTTFARHKVSKQKRRFKDKKNGFDLDLTYITKRMIAMGFPSEKTEALYRNPMPEVQRFYEFFHRDHYYLYNLCQERTYDAEKFNGRMSHFPFYDHNAPPLALISECCNHIEDWLNQDEENIVGINCKAGKGRTGLIICCYLLHSGECTTSDEALVFYGNRRTKDGKGVTIASQQRYIRYYEKVLNDYNGVIPPAISMKMTRLRITAYPRAKLPEGLPFASIEINDEITHVSPVGKVEKVSKGVYKADIPVHGIVEGDVKIQISLKKKGGGKQKLCHFWFNSGFIPESMVLDHEKQEIDVANKDKKCKVFSENFAIQAFFADVEKKPSKKSKKGKKMKDSKKKNTSKTPKEGKSKTAKESKTPKESKKKPKKPKPSKEPKKIIEQIEADLSTTSEVVTTESEKPVETASPTTPESTGTSTSLTGTSTEESESSENGVAEPVSSSEEPPAFEQNDFKVKSTKRKSFYDYSDYGTLQDQIELSEDSEAMSFSSSD